MEPTKPKGVEAAKRLAGRVENVEPVLCQASGEQFFNTSPLDLVQTSTPDGAPDLVILEKHRFEDLGERLSRITATSLVDSFEVRDSFIAAGLAEGYDRLDDLLTTL